MRLSAALGSGLYYASAPFRTPSPTPRSPLGDLYEPPQPSRYATEVDSKTQISLSTTTTHVDLIHTWRRAPEEILAPLASGLCTILQANFAEFPFYALR